MLGPIEVTPTRLNNSISFMIPSFGKNMNRLYKSIFILINSAGSDTSNINMSELILTVLEWIYEVFGLVN